ncbi:predicted phosphatase [Vibrio ponticus]|uniref:HAD family hydrolase n=1 Tax=Vibrio rhodolitus TaxID=2231649 RepID=UPI000501FF9F|nr:HAD-IA family hydrolase [Vibrio rhodolitus]GAK83121.1 predicted phosphatase [Vibrio ponticus]
MDKFTVVPFEPQRIKAIVFDLDNTLVSSDMDFFWLRDELGCPADRDLLTFTEEIRCPEQRANAEQRILDHELEDARSSYPMPGCVTILRYIERKALHTAIITRNCLQAATTKVKHNNLSIERIISREHFAPKPSPDALNSLADEWQLAPPEVLYVGDYLYDLQAANNANMPSCLVDHGIKKPFEHQASVVVNHLNDLTQLLTLTNTGNNR